MDIKNLTIKEARILLDKKDISAEELSGYYLKNIESKNKKLNVYLEVYDDVLEQAKNAQLLIDQGKSMPLTGIPLSLKDNLLVKGRKVSAASKMLENYTASYTATAVQKLIDQGAVLLGRVNMDEFACGGSTENSAFGVTYNPHDIERVAGGSSGGSAASVAADMALGSLGSDTGGSVREPAGFCGVVGLKPTYGSVSRNGLMAMGSSLDIIGTLTKNVADAEILFDSIKGKDKMDATSIELEYKSQQLKANTVGIPRHLLEMDGISKEVRDNFEQSVKKLKDLGFEIVDLKLPNIEKALAVYYIIMPAELSSNLARFDGMRYGLRSEGDNLMSVYKNSRRNGFGSEIRRRIILGTYVLSAGYYDAFYGKAMIAREIIKQDFEEAFKKVDVVITPTAPTPAWKVGEKSSPLEVYLADIFTVSANIAGIPAMSVPGGFAKINGKDLPIGVQFMAPNLNEDALFSLGKKFLGEK